MDPILQRMPQRSSPEESIRHFYLSILDEMDRRKVYPAAIKPNSAYYEAVSVQAVAVLQELIQAYSQRGVLAVLDAKRGDIGKSSSAYAQAAFEVMQADAVTISPYMGSDSVSPFLQWNEERGAYILLRTSNPGSKDLQDQPLKDGKPFWKAVAEQLLLWNNGSLGAVVGATNLSEMEKIARFFADRQTEIPFLIPGLSVPGVAGQQGGEAAEVMQALRRGGSTRSIHLLNSSSGLSFAFEATPGVSFWVACVDALERLSEQTRF